MSAIAALGLSLALARGILIAILLVAVAYGFALSRWRMRRVIPEDIREAPPGAVLEPLARTIVRETVVHVVWLVFVVSGVWVIPVGAAVGGGAAAGIVLEQLRGLRAIIVFERSQGIELLYEPIRVFGRSGRIALVYGRRLQP